MFKNVDSNQIYNSPAAHGGPVTANGWTYEQKYMQYIWRHTPRIVETQSVSVGPLATA